MFENIRLAFQGIWSHKMRSFLTMLGIIIGIASIIAIVSTIKGTSEQIKEDLIGSGNNTVNITLSQGDSAYSADYYSDSSVVTPLLSQELKNEVLKADHVVNATFFYSRTDYNSNVYYENSSFSGGKVYGVDKNYLDTCGYQVRSGRGFVQQDYDDFRKVALVDSYAADTIFPGENPVGKIIEIGSEPFTVVGVIRQASDSLPNMDSPNEFYNYYESIIASNVVLEAIKADPSTLQDQYAYLTKTNDGRLLKSSTFYIKDESGTLAYIFSINYDITALAAADQFLQSFIQTQNPAEPSASRSATPQITHNVTELLDTLIEQAISNIGKPAALMTKDEKVRVVQYLNDAGAFLITKSGDKVASILGISKFTLYNYMDAGK